MSSLNFEAQRSHCVLNAGHGALIAYHCWPAEITWWVARSTPQRAADPILPDAALLVDSDVRQHGVDNRQRVQQPPLRLQIKRLAGLARGRHPIDDIE